MTINVDITFERRGELVSIFANGEGFPSLFCISEEFTEKELTPKIIRIIESSVTRGIQIERDRVRRLLEDI